MRLRREACSNSTAPFDGDQDAGLCCCSHQSWIYGTDGTAVRWRGLGGLLRQHREELVDLVEEALGLGFLVDGAAFVVLVVAQGGLGISPRTAYMAQLGTEC